MYDFADQTAADTASGALASALNDPGALPAGVGSNPSFIAGITNGGYGEIDIPYQDIGGSVFTSAATGAPWGIGSDAFLPSDDMSTSSSTVYAKFTAASAVPEPASLSLMAVGLAGLWGRKRVARKMR